MPSPEAPAGVFTSGPRAVPWALRLELAALFLAGAYALLFQLRLPGRLPAETDYRDLSAVLNAQVERGDVVLLYPWWTERLRLFVHEGIPVVGYLGSDADPLEDYARIWLVAQPDLPRSNLAGFLRELGRDRRVEGGFRKFGKLQLALFHNGRYRRKVFSAANAVAEARVYLENERGQRTECRFDGRAHRCPSPNIYVASEIHEIHFAPQKCLWMHPPGGSTRLVAEFSDLPAADKLVLRGGLTWDREYFTRGMTPVSIRVETGDSHRLIDLNIAPGTTGVQRMESPAPPEQKVVKLSVGSENPEGRDVCVELFGQKDSSREGA